MTFTSHFSEHTIIFLGPFRPTSHRINIERAVKLLFKQSGRQVDTIEFLVGQGWVDKADRIKIVWRCLILHFSIVHVGIFTVHTISPVHFFARKRRGERLGRFLAISLGWLWP